MEKLIEEIEGLRRENSNLRSYATQLNQDRSREFRHYPSNIQLLRKSAEIEPLDTNRSHSLPTVRRNPSERSDSHLDFQSKDKAIMVDTFDDFYVREEYNQRIEEMLNEKEQMQSRLNELLQERDSQQRVQQQHVREFELQRNQIKELGQKMKVNEQNKEIQEKTLRFRWVSTTACQRISNSRGIRSKNLVKDEG